MSHPTSDYTNHQCRCAPCTEAWRVRLKEYRARIRAVPLAADDPRHGTTNFYSNYGCRCDACRAAGREEAQRRRARNKARKG